MGLLMTTPGAWLVRMVRFGTRDANRQLASAYCFIAPFEDRKIKALEIDNRYQAMLESIPEIGLEDLVSSPSPVVLSPHLQLGEGAMPARDLLPFLALLCSLRPLQAFEIGTFNGTATSMMALNSPDTVIHTLDLPPDDRTGGTLLEQDDFHLIKKRKLGAAFPLAPQGRIIQYHGDSACWDYSLVREATFVFIDGAHTYDYIRNDTEKTLAHCRKPLTVVWHDCDLYHGGVVRWLSEMVAKGMPVRRIRGTALAVMQPSDG